MKKYVYKITNNLNKKVYIGQTNDLKRRFQEHLHDKRKNHPIHEALKKYGKENFDYCILYYGENYNNEEKKWIRYYKTQNKEYGYNIVEGGQDSSGENNPMASITKDQAKQIIHLLLNSNLQHNEIAKKVNCSTSNVNNINVGYSWHDDKYKYPLRTNRLNEEQYNEIFSLLKKSNLSFDLIADKMGLDKSIIQNINTGKTYKHENVKYPIRKRYIDKKDSDKIKHFLINTKMYYKDIAKETNTTISVVSKINYGKAWIDNNLNYPLRNK